MSKNLRIRRLITVLRLLEFARRHIKMASIQFTLALIGTCLILVFPGIVQWFLDDIIPNKRAEEVIPISLIALTTFMGREVLYYVRTRLNSIFEQKMIFDLRSQLYRKITRLPVSWFDHKSTGDILARMTEDVPGTQKVILEGIEQGVTAILQIIIVSVMMFFTHWKLALLVVIPTPFIAMGGWFYAKWVSPKAKIAREAASELNCHLHDTVTGIRQIKCYTSEEKQQNKFANLSESLSSTQKQLMAAWAIYSPSMSFLGNLGLVLLLAFGSYWTVQGELKSGELVSFLLLVGFLYEPISRLHGVNQTLVSGLVAAQRVFSIIDLRIEEKLEKGEELRDIKGSIEYHNVTFAYIERAPAVHNASISIKPQQTVAIVGATGSGKSTLFQLLMRFYEPLEGSIALDGKALNRYSKASLRDQITYVTQDAFLFAGSVRDNLLLGNPDANDFQLWEALKLACADEFVSRMNGGLDSQVGERGIRLSGGERQRIALARAFLKNSPILLLDEATSALDTRSEQLIKTAINKLRQNRTCIIIAHRLSTILEADQIIVMQQGYVVGRGTHQELLETCAYYAELVTLSFEKRTNTPTASVITADIPVNNKS